MSKVVIPAQSIALLRLITAATAVSDGYDLGVVNGVSMILANTYSKQVISFFVSVLPAFVALGALGGALTADKFGRKPVLILSYLLLIGGAGIMAVPGHLMITIAGRALVGLGVGIGGVVGTVYMAEIAPTKNRGSLVAQETLFVSCGLLLGYLSNYLFMGSNHNYNLMLGLGAVLPAFCLVALLTIGRTLPESPHWERLNAQEEQEHLVPVDAGNDDVAVVKSIKQLFSEFWASPGAFPAMLVGVLQPLCGIGPILYFSDLTFSTIETNSITAEEEGTLIQVQPVIAMSSIYIGLVKVVTLLISTLFLMDRVGRKTLLLTSSFLIVASMAFIGSVITWVSSSQSLLLFAFCCAVFSYALGWNCVTAVYPSEVLPTKIRTFGISVMTIGGRLISVTNAFLFPLVGLQRPNIWFFTFAGINAVSFGLVLTYLKETLNKPLILGYASGKAELSDREEIADYPQPEEEREEEAPQNSNSRI